LFQLQILICQLETPLSSTVKALRNFKGTSILNAAPAMSLPEEVLKLPSIFCVNELEAEGITGIEIKDLTQVFKTIIELRKRGCQMVVVTLGKLGAAFNDDSGKIFHVPLPAEVKAVDTVGAGDAFIGALAYFIAKYPNATWIQRIGASVEIASHSVQFKGTQTSFVNFPVINPSTKTYKFVELS
jgi:ribokinase